MLIPEYPYQYYPKVTKQSTIDRFNLTRGAPSLQFRPPEHSESLPFNPNKIIALHGYGNSEIWNTTETYTREVYRI